MILLHIQICSTISLIQIQSSLIIPESSLVSSQATFCTASGDTATFLGQRSLFLLPSVYGNPLRTQLPETQSQGNWFVSGPEIQLSSKTWQHLGMVRSPKGIGKESQQGAQGTSAAQELPCLRTMLRGLPGAVTSGQPGSLEQGPAGG